MALILEITKADGSVVTTPIDGPASTVAARPGDHFRVIDPKTGKAPADMNAVREGDNLIIDGLPETASIELCDFFKRGEDDDEACVLATDSGDLIAPTAAPVQLAQNKTDAEKKATEMTDKAGSTAAPEKAVVETDAAGKATAADAAATTTETEAAAAAAANPAISTSAIAIGAIGLVGVAAAASGGSSDSPPPGSPPGSPPGTPPGSPPPAPTGLAVEGSDNSLSPSEVADGITVTGMAEAGSNVTITLLNGSAVAATTTAIADQSGAFSATIPAGNVPAAGTYTVSATASNTTGAGAAATLPGIVIEGPAAPDAPTGGTINPADLGADSAVGFAEGAGGDGINFTGAAGAALAGSTVEVTLLSGATPVMVDVSGTPTAVTGTAVAQGDGSYSVTIPGGDGSALDNLPGGSYTPSFTATSGGLTSAATTGTAFTVLPQSPNFLNIEGGDSNVSSTEMAGGLDVSGTTEPGATVDIQLFLASDLVTPLETLSGVSADATTGAFTATLADMGYAPGSYTIRTTTTSNGLVSDAPNNANIQIQNGTVGGSATTLNGTIGDDVLVGDYGGAIQNGNFEYWDTTGGDLFDETAGNGGTNGAFSYSLNTSNQLVSAPELGWALSIGAAAIDPDSDANTQDYFNHSAGTLLGGVGATDPTDGRVEFLDVVPGDSGVGVDQYVWDTQSDPFYGGGGLSQTVSTVAGEAYSLVVSVDPATSAVPPGGEDTIVQVSWDGAVIAQRGIDGSWTGTNPPTTATAGESDYTFNVVGGSGTTTALSIVAFDRHFDGANTNPGDGGDDDGLIITNVALTAANAAAANGDTINGGDGNDVIFGQGGDDSLTGDTGNDTFVYSMAIDNGNDVIADLTAGDRVVLTDVLNTAGAATAFADNASSDVALDLNDVSASGVQEVGITTNGTGDVVLTLTGASGSLGSVTLTGVVFGANAGAGEYNSVGALISDQVLVLTGNGFNPDL